jgi:hypothetical protein
MTQPELEQLILAGPRWQRPAMRMLLTLGARPRGRRLLALLAPADYAAAALLAMARYDDREEALALGWDAATVVQRGRALRRAEGRP